MTLRVRDFKKSNTFYLEPLAALGITQKFSVDRADGPLSGYGTERVSFFISGGVKAEAGIHLALGAWSQAEVDSFYEAALKGRRMRQRSSRPASTLPGYYAAFVCGPDGNNIAAVFHGDL